MKADSLPLESSLSVNPWYLCFRDSSDGIVCPFHHLAKFLTSLWFCIQTLDRVATGGNVVHV